MIRLSPFFIITNLLFISITLHVNHAIGQHEIKKEIAQLINSAQAEVGVAIRQLESGDTISFNGSDRFPMQSVYKFHVALAVLHAVDKGKLSIDQQVYLRKEDLMPNTHSPIADEYPDGNVSLTVRQLISYTVAKSDNSGCDILFRLVGGPPKVHEYIRELGVLEVAIANTENEMHQNQDLQYKNWTTPVAMVQLLDLLYRGKILLPSTRHVLLEIMENTNTGNKRIKGNLPMGTLVAHKTGTSGQNEKGVLGALNDVGIITLPNGQHVAIALFISNTKESMSTLEGLMAAISKKIFDHYLNLKQ